MIYRSNLTCPDLQPHFVNICKPRPWSMGHDVMSDPDFEPECCFMTHDEAAILYHCAKNCFGYWSDLGSRFGWTSAHIAEATGTLVRAVDQAYEGDRFTRFWMNTRPWREIIKAHGFSTEKFFQYSGAFPCSGYCIDANHDAPEPLKDAQGAYNRLCNTGCIVFHDFWGRPIREGVEWLMSQGMKCRTYDTPNGMAVCWRGDFVPPDHVPDPAINWRSVRKGRAPEFDFSRTV